MVAQQHFGQWTCVSAMTALFHAIMSRDLHKLCQKCPCSSLNVFHFIICCPPPPPPFAPDWWRGPAGQSGPQIMAQSSWQGPSVSQGCGGARAGQGKQWNRKHYRSHWGGGALSAQFVEGLSDEGLLITTVVVAVGHTVDLFPADITEAYTSVRKTRYFSGLWFVCFFIAGCDYYYRLPVPLSNSCLLSLSESTVKRLILSWVERKYLPCWCCT